jgi:hypothetical protein
VSEQPDYSNSDGGGALDPDRWYSIVELTVLLGGSDRLYRGEIAARRLKAIYTGEWQILGANALAWGQARADRRLRRPSGD